MFNLKIKLSFMLVVFRMMVLQQHLDSELYSSKSILKEYYNFYIDGVNIVVLFR